jgi:hypothetical protein
MRFIDQPSIMDSNYKMRENPHVYEEHANYDPSDVITLILEFEDYQNMNLMYSKINNLIQLH